MGHAVVQRLRDEHLARPKVVYFGLLMDKEGKDAEQALQERIYSSWDGDPSSPAKSRPRDPVPDPSLQILGWQDSQPFFPESLIQKFAAGTHASKKVLEMRDKLQAMFPHSTPVVAGGRATVVAPRASGRPDFTIEGGQEPIDPARCVDLAVIPAASFNEPR